MSSSPELLAPAGSKEALLAALANGADAVYLGSASFGARSSAGFDDEAFADAVRFTHLHARRVYVTVNTLVKQNELADVRNTLQLVQKANADAVLVQDTGVLRMIKSEFPSMAVHASTQMSIHNATGAAFLRECGVNRVVLARECNMQAIRAATVSGIEVEVFVHGALCVSVSGQCQCSALLGGRSGNRGRCAQPCRLPYTYKGHPGAWLSPRDICMRDDLPSLWGAGVSSFKIEGRLKRPEYVAVVTRAYRNAIDAMAEKRFLPANIEEQWELKQIFHRGGFTRGYAANAQDAGIIDPKRVSHDGLRLGAVTRTFSLRNVPLCEVLLEKALHDGDGLQIRGNDEQEIIYSGPAKESGELATLRLHSPAKPWDVVFRLCDEHQLSNAREGYGNRALLVPFDAILTAYPGQRFVLNVSNSRASVSIEGDVVQSSVDKPLDTKIAQRSIAKSGGTPFVLRDFSYQGQNAFISVASLNSCRREALIVFAEKLIQEHKPISALPEKTQTAIRPFLPHSRQLYVKCTRAQAAEALMDAGADVFLFSPEDYTEQHLLKEFDLLPGNTFLCFPAQANDDTIAMLVRIAMEHKLGISIGSIGQLGATIPTLVMASEGVPVWNSEAIRFLASRGCVWQVLSREASRREILELPYDIAHLILPVYGRSCLMLLNHCPERTKTGAIQGHAECRLCETGNGLRGQALTDRLGYSFPLSQIRLPEGCVASMMNYLPRHLGIKAPAMSWQLNFTDEDDRTRMEITQYYRALMDSKPYQEPKIHGIVERFLNGVE